MGCKGPTELLLEKWASNCRAAIIGRNSSSFRSSHCAGDKTTEKCVFLLASDFLDKSRASSLALPCLLTSCRCRTTQWKQHRSSNELRMKIAYPPEAMAQNCEWEAKPQCLGDPILSHLLPEQSQGSSAVGFPKGKVHFLSTDRTWSQGYQNANRSCRDVFKKPQG